MAQPKLTCHRTGHQDLCEDHQPTCPLWVKIDGIHPQTGEPLEKWGCADTQNLVATLEVAKRVYELSAEISELRKSVDKPARVVDSETLGKFFERSLAAGSVGNSRQDHAGSVVPDYKFSPTDGEESQGSH